MPLTLVSMAKTVREKQDASRPMTEPAPTENMPDYPYGLTLSLDTESLKKLGFARGQLKPGDQVIGKFIGMVTSSSATSVNGIQQFTAALQIQDLAVERVPDEDSRATSLYPKETPNAS